VTTGSGNVFEDLGFPDAAEHQIKAGLVGQIADIVERRKMTQAAAAEVLGIDQPKVSAMLNGRFRGFAVYRLMNFLAVLGSDVEIVATERDPNSPSVRGGITVRGAPGQESSRAKRNTRIRADQKLKPSALVQVIGNV